MSEFIIPSNRNDDTFKQLINELNKNGWEEFTSIKREIEKIVEISKIIEEKKMEIMENANSGSAIKTKKNNSCPCGKNNLPQKRNQETCDGCNNLVPFSCIVKVPSTFFVIENVAQVAFETNCISCTTEACNLGAADVGNPCNPSFPFQNVPVEVNSIRALGCIPFTVSLSGINKNNGSFGFFSCEGSSCVDNVVCLTPNPFTCSSSFFNGTSYTITSILKISSPSPSEQLYSVAGNFILPVCPSGASTVSIDSFPSTICEGNSSLIFGQVLGNNGAVVPGATVNFTVDKPALANVLPNSVVAGAFGQFSTILTSINGPGTVVVTATVLETGASASKSIDILECPR